MTWIGTKVQIFIVILEFSAIYHRAHKKKKNCSNHSSQVQTLECYYLSDAFFFGTEPKGSN